MLAFEFQGQSGNLKKVVIFIKNELNQLLLIDWFQVTFHDKVEYEEKDELDPDTCIRTFGFTPYDYFMKFFKVKREDVVFQPKGLFGYTYTYQYGNIKLFTSDRTDMGFHIYLTGQACREFEQLGLDWKELIESLQPHQPHFTRIDLAIDDFTDDYFTIERIRKCVANGEVVSKFRLGEEINTRILEDGRIRSETIWFGSRASRLQLVFYNKLYERTNANYKVEEEVKHWYRCELRFRSDRADNVIKEYYHNQKGLNEIIKGVLNNYLHFKKKNSKETHKSRWSDQTWWNSFLEGMDKLSLCKKHPETNIVRKKRWINHSVSATELEVMLSSIDDLSLDDKLCDYLLEVIQHGYDKMDEERLMTVNKHRVLQGLEPITLEQVNDFVKDLQGVMLLSNRLE